MNIGPLLKLAKCSVLCFLFQLLSDDTFFAAEYKYHKINPSKLATEPLNIVLMLQMYHVVSIFEHLGNSFKN